MIKLKVARDKGGPLVVFGLSAQNITRMKAGSPIKINLADLGLEGEIFIFVGDTEDSMMKELVDAGLVPAAAASTGSCIEEEE